MKNQMKGKKGITLVALVITIIVLLILAGVTIATLTGDNGLLQKATTAKQANEEVIALEKIQAEVAGSYGLDGKIDLNELNKNLIHLEGLRYNNEAIDVNDDNKKINELPAIVKLDEYNFLISDNGEVYLPQTIDSITKDNYGDYIDLGQNVIGTSATTDDWRIIYNDKIGHVYAILADYLPNNNTAVTLSGLNVVTRTEYNVKSTISSHDLQEKLNNTTAWQTLIKEKFRNNCQVTGAITAEILYASYNEKYNLSPPKNYTPYPSSYLYIDNDSSKGIDTLYVPRLGSWSDPYHGCYAYWLTLNDDSNVSSLYRIYNSGICGNNNYHGNNDIIGLCPAVSIPSNKHVINNDGVWILVE